MLTDAIPPKIARTLCTFGKRIEFMQMHVWKMIVKVMLNFCENFSRPVVIKYKAFLKGM